PRLRRFLSRARARSRAAQQHAPGPDARTVVRRRSLALRRGMIALPARTPYRPVSARWPRFHSQCQVGALKIADVEVAHAVVVVPRWLDHSSAARSEFGVDRIDIPHEDAYRAVAG